MTERSFGARDFVLAISCTGHGRPRIVRTRSAEVLGGGTTADKSHSKSSVGSGSHANKTNIRSVFRCVRTVGFRWHLAQFRSPRAARGDGGTSSLLDELLSQSFRPQATSTQRAVKRSCQTARTSDGEPRAYGPHHQ